MWTSGITLYGLFWDIYILHLAVKLLYPLKSVKLDRSDYSRKVHILEILTVFVIGTTPYIVFASTSQYEAVIFPPFYCAYNTIYLFYGTVLPTLIIGCFGLILMLLVLYKLHIVSVTVKQPYQLLPAIYENVYTYAYTCVYICICVCLHLFSLNKTCLSI